MDPEAAELLAQHYRENIFTLGKTDIALKEIGARFFANRIPWLTFKGLPLARQLYPEPGWRLSHDIDLLVPPHVFAKARTLLTDDGFVVVNTQLPSEHWLERAMEGIAKDVALKQTRSRLLIELHRRLFFSGTEEIRDPLLRNTFKLRFATSAKDIPVPELSAGMALYLALHGASARWFRLKWLIDLLPLLKMLDDEQKCALIDAAERVKGTVSVKAAFLLLGRVFEDVRLGPIGEWLGEPGGKAIVEARAADYLAALDNQDADSPKSNKRRFGALDLHYSMMDGWRYRSAVLTRGAAWMALNTLRHLL